MSIDWFESRTGLSNEDIAVIDLETDQSYSYTDMNQRAHNLAYYLRKKGVEAGDCVALFAQNNIGHLDFMLACAKIGAVFLPLNWRLKKEEVAGIVVDAEIVFLAYAADVLYRMDTDMIARYPHIDIDSQDYHVLVTESVSKVPILDIDDEQTAVLLYSSGTTGKPKGIKISRRAILANGFSTITSWDLSQATKTITISPFFHTAGLFGTVVPTLLVGGTVIILKEFEEQNVLDAIRRYQITLVFMVPTMYYMLANYPAFDATSLESVKLFISGGAPISEKVLRFYYANNLPVINSFGMTEVGPNNFYLNPQLKEEKFFSIGRPTLLTEIKIVNEKMEEVGIDEIGELLIKSAGAFSGYLNLAEKTEGSFHEGYVRTGDLARMDAEGYYYLAGRRKDLIISGGENVVPGEVERVLDAHPLVKEAIVVGYPTEKWGESVAAAVILNEEAEDFADILNEWSLSKLAGYKTPKQYLKMDVFPQTSTGKISRKDIKKLFSE